MLGVVGVLIGGSRQSGVHRDAGSVRAAVSRPASSDGTALDGKLDQGFECKYDECAVAIVA